MVQLVELVFVKKRQNLRLQVVPIRNQNASENDLINSKKCFLKRDIYQYCKTSTTTTPFFDAVIARRLLACGVRINVAQKGINVDTISCTLQSLI